MLSGLGVGKRRKLFLSYRGLFYHAVCKVNKMFNIFLDIPSACIFGITFPVFILSGLDSRPYECWYVYFSIDLSKAESLSFVYGRYKNMETPCRWFDDFSDLFLESQSSFDHSIQILTTLLFHTISSTSIKQKLSRLLL